eukprot:9383668-Pyramimonas_sp.AAC.1
MRSAALVGAGKMPPVPRWIQCWMRNPAVVTACRLGPERTGPMRAAWCPDCATWRRACQSP